MDNHIPLTITLFAKDNPISGSLPLAVMPDYDEIINQCIPVIGDEKGKITVLENGNAREVDSASFVKYFEHHFNGDNTAKFICFDAVDIHKKLLAVATTPQEKQLVWRLTDNYARWEYLCHTHHRYQQSEFS